MGDQSKKVAVLNLLQANTQETTTKELLSKLGPDYSIRSLRRWLSELVKDGLVEKTGKAIGFDEIRVRYRQQRRSMLSEIISQKIVGKKLQTFIQTEIPKMVGELDRADFIEDLREDLQEMSPSRIAGLGITLKQLDEWISAR